MPTSNQRWTIRSGTVHAVVGAQGGGICELIVDGATVIADVGPDDVRAAFDGLLLAPWPNRIPVGAWSHHGRPQQLAISEPATNSAVHGLVAWSGWRPVRVDNDAVELAIDVLPQPGYPFHLELSVVWSVSSDGLRCRLNTRNAGAGDAPFGVAAHPYVGVPGAAVDDLELTVPANTWLEVDANLHPVALHDVTDSGYDFRAGTALAGVSLDTAFADRIGTESAYIAGPAGTVEMWADDSFRWWQVYTSDYFADDSPRLRSTVALEPMTCGPNAFNTGRDLIVLGAGDEWTGAWGVRYSPT